MKREAPWDQTVTSHKALFTKDTHTHTPSPPPHYVRSAKPDPSKVPGQEPVRLILPLVLLAEMEAKGRE